MFTGFNDETFTYFVALRFNNNREFFNANRDWYERAVRQPLARLCEDLEPYIHAIDPSLDTRPVKAVSRIIRDMRYVHDGAPYRDYMWLGFHQAGVPKMECFSFYFDVSDKGMDAGVGIFGDNKPWMDCVRTGMLRHPDAALKVFTDPALTQFELHGNSFRRIAIPPELPPELHDIYARKGFYFEHEYKDMSVARTHALVDDIAARYAALAPMYRLMNEWKAVYAPDNP